MFIVSVILTLIVSVGAHAGETILHSFLDGSVTNDGQYPTTALVQGGDGNFYGTTGYGGTAGYGIAYKMTASGTVTVLHLFGDGSVTNDGAYPYAALIQGSDGNFYGTTRGGGSPTFHDGTIFKMTPSGTVTILHDFRDGTVLNDGSSPYAGLVQGSDGNFYGTTGYGGSAGEGVVFQMTPAGAVTILHSFGDKTVPNDGQHPYAGLVQGNDGSFYGTTGYGGASGDGTVFKITSAGTVTILHSFHDGTVTGDGIFPNAALIQSGDGNFYGTTTGGGTAGQGVVFKVTPTGTVTLLHSFGDGSVIGDGEVPYSALVRGTDGNFYGTTESGGSAGDGTVYLMTTTGLVTIVHSFRDGSVAADGIGPESTLIQAGDGDFYGTAVQGGTNGDGTTYKLAAGLTVPHLTSLSPASVQAGTFSFTLTATGTSFSTGTTIDWNGAALATTLVAPTQLTAPVSAALVASQGTAQITAVTPGTTPSAARLFSITAPPTLTSVSPASFSAGSGATLVTATGTNFVSGATIDWNGVPLTTTFVSATQLTATVPAMDLTSAQIAQITAVNLNVTPTAAQSVSVLAPGLTTISPTQAVAGTAAFTLTATGTHFVAGSLIDWNGSALSTTYVSATQLTASVPAALIGAAGTAAVTVVSASAVSGARTFTIQPAPPTITSFTPTSGPVGTFVTITGTNFTGATSVTFNGTTAATYTVVSATSITASVPAGATTGKIAVTTPGGTATSAGTFTVIPAPTITSFAPTSGPIGTSVTITGTSFTGATAVKFNGITATTYTVVSATSITTTVPVGATTGTITVTTAGGTATSAAAFTVSAPTITSFSPTSGPVGTSVTITGTNFTGATAVKFNGTTATTFSVISATGITATVPPGATTGTVAVTTSGGTATSASTFTIIPAPTITSFAPTSGPIGTSVAITGTNFTGTTSVKVNGTTAVTYTVVSATSITATVPVGATTGKIAVATPGGTATSAATFTVILAPSITSFAPTSGPVGTSVTITGTNFTGATAVKFNGTAAITYTVVSATSITATVPAGATTGKIAVTTPGGTATSATTFTVT